LPQGRLNLAKKRVATPRTNGFVERFKRTVLEEFFRGILRKKFYTSLDELQKDHNQWMHEYNTERPHLGYRNMGKTPIKSFNDYKQKQKSLNLKKCPVSP